MKTLRLLIFVCLPFFSFSQLENTQWRFSYQCGLSFTTNPPAQVASNLTGGGGSCSSIADAAGNLLFYTNGNVVYNRLNQYLAGTSGNLTGAGSTQGVLIAKQPGNNSFYYIFTAGNSGLRYSIVDMSLAAGLGSVTVMNATLSTQQQSYKIAGTRTCNNSGLWIVTQNDGQFTWNSYLLSSTGISAAVTSTTGHQHIVYAAMKFSPDCTKIASTEWGDGVYLYDFNPATGAVSGTTVVAGSGFAAWGVEFSPNGKVLYATRSYASVFQYDLSAGSATAIAASEYSVYVTSFSFNGNQGALQLAPDGKIYQAYGNAGVLSVINNPNTLGAACNYTFGAINIAPKSCSYGLPNQIKNPPPLPSFTSAISQNTCQTVLFGPITTTVGGINSNLPLSVNWIFGDPGSGALNFSSQLNPSHLFSSAGTYTVKMLLQNSCSITDTIYQVVNVPNTAANLAFTGNTLVCMGESTTLTVNGANSYTWNSSLGQATGSAVVVNPLASTSFTVGAQNANSCITYSNFAVTVLPPSTFSVSGATSLCAGSSTTLTALGVSNYTWLTTTGPVSTSSTVVINPPIGQTTYTVFGYNPSLTCVGQLPVTLSVSNGPAVSIAAPTLVCQGSMVTLVGIGASTFTWSFPGLNLYGPIITHSFQTSQTITVSALNANQPCVNTSNFTIQADACLGLTPTSVNNCKIYPNPFHNNLFIDSELAYNIRIVDVLGQLIYATVGTSGTTELDLSTLKAGSYTLLITTDTGIKALKIVKG